MPEPKSEYADLIARLRATDGKGQGGPAKALAADAIESLERRLDRVRLDCAEAYQVVGALTNYLGMDDGPDATKPLDNYRAAVSCAQRCPSRPRRHERGWRFVIRVCHYVQNPTSPINPRGCAARHREDAR